MCILLLDTQVTVTAMFHYVFLHVWPIVRLACLGIRLLFHRDQRVGSRDWLLTLHSSLLMEQLTEHIFPIHTTPDRPCQERSYC